MPPLPPAILPDTNFLLDYPYIHQENWLLSPLEILISETVISELRGLSHNYDPELSRKAQVALLEIEKYQGPLASLTESHLGVKIKLVERCTDLVEPLDPQVPDHQIIAYARKQFQADPPCFCAILSNDKELCDIAEALTIITISRHNEQRFHQELKRKYQWWVKLKKAEMSSVVPHQKVKRNKARKEHPEKEVLLNRSIIRLYRRIEAIGCRTTIYLAPLEARLALTLEVIRRLRNPERQVVVVVVESTDATRYWAGEIRQKGDYSANEVQIFGVDPIDRIDHAKVVIYRHNQITRRLLQHVARLDQAEKRITAVVDGCDILDPVELAILLYECDQFIGLNHLPVRNKQTRGHRALSLILHNRSLIDYSFADAERDGWGHACDLYLHKVELTADERKLWDEINTDYLRRRERAIKKIPELSEDEYFWKALDKFLTRFADPEMAELIKQREQLEQIAQIAQNKLSQVFQLIQTPPKQPFRRMIFDYAQQWTPVILKELMKTDVKVTVLPAGDSQRIIWDQFAGNRVDTLVLSKIPAFDLPGANFHQLIIMTPLRPLDEMLAMIDWAISHTHTKDSLRLDVIFVDDTPEEIAMLGLAEASFDLRYS